MPLPRAVARTAPILVALFVVVWLYFGLRLEGWVNTVEPARLPDVGPRAEALHATSFVADLHADSLLFGRDLLERARIGHVDLPRLVEGGVALQVFSVVSKAPWGYALEGTDGERPDHVTQLAITYGWPVRTWFDLRERVVYQASRLAEMAERSGGRLRVVRGRAGLEALLRDRARGDAVVGALLAIEGAHVLGEDFRSDLDHLFESGVRMASLTHFFDDAFAGSVNGLSGEGLTPRGRELVALFEERGVALDLSHASAATIEDVLRIASKPVVVSHTGVEATCGEDKNLSDAQIRAIASNGGVIGIGLWDTAVCGTTATETVRAMLHVISLVGDTHVGLGSDFDGVVRAHFDATGLPLVTQALLDAGLEPDAVRRILGGNVLRVLRQTLP